MYKIKRFLPKSNLPQGQKLLYAVWFIIFFSVFSGTLRKWVLGEGAMGNIVFLIQLFIPLIFYIVTLKSALPKVKNVPFMWLIYLFYLVLTALNPMNHTPYHGLLGLLVHTGYLLIWLAYIQKGRYLELEKLVPFFLVILVIEFVLASLQYSLPNEHFLNMYASGQESSAFVGDAVRASGTFSYIGAFQGMLPIFACVAWFMMLKNDNLIYIVLVLILGLATALMTGSRAAVGFFILYSITAFLLSGNIANRIFKVLAQGVIIVCFLIIVLPPIMKSLEKIYDNFMYRVENSDNVNTRVSGSYTSVFDFRGEYPIFGVGLGATYQGANALLGTSIYVKEYGGYEREPARIVLEGGYILFIFRIFLILVFLKHTDNLPLLAKVFFLLVFLNLTITFNIYQGLFFVLGLVLVDRGYYLKYKSINNK
jgi:hypothetical protein